MPRVVTVQTRFHDPVAVAACRRLGLPPPVFVEVALAGRVVHGHRIELASGQAPAVLDTLTGLLRCPCAEGERLPNRHLNRFLRAYVAEKTARLARQPESGRRGEDVAELAAELMEIEVSSP